MSGQRVCHMFDQTNTGKGTLVESGSAVGYVIWDARPGHRHPVIKEEVIFLDSNDQVPKKKPKVEKRDRDDDDSDGRGRRDRSLVASI